MAGDWIKMRIGLQNGDPHVVRIMSALCPQGVRTVSAGCPDKLRIIGGLHAVWCLFDQHSTDGRLTYSTSELDQAIGFEGFSDAMISVGWLAKDGDNALIMHNFDAHNGRSAKRRASESLRKKNVRNLSAERPHDSGQKADQRREEKRREEGVTETPSDLHELSYAAKLIAEINMPDTPQNIRAVAAGIKAEQKPQGNLAKAYEFVLAEARKEIERSGAVEGFWFQDTKWRKKAKAKDKRTISTEALEKNRQAKERLSK